MANVTKMAKSNGAERDRNLTTEIRRRVEQLSAINRVTAVVSQSLDLNATLQTAMDAVLSVIPVEASGISLIDERAGELVLRAQRGWKKDFVTTPMRIKLGHGLSGQVVATGEVVITGDLTNDPRLVVPAVAEENIQSMAMAPMHARGKVIGVLSVISYQPYTFDEQEISVLKAIADQVGVALDNARLYEATREQQSRLLTVLQSTADAIIATDSHGNVNLINEAAERLFDLRADDVFGQPLYAIALPPELHDGLIRSMSPDAPSTFNVTASDARIFDVALANGCFLSAVVSPVTTPSRLEERLKNGWVVVFQDVTHIKEAERARLQFIQMAAHDLRNPLGVTLSALTMLNKSWKNQTPTDVEVFGIALRGVNRMQDLIDDLLHLEKIESGVDFQLEPLDLAELIENSALDISPVLQRREQTLSVETPPLLPAIHGDQRWLFRALTNLLSNAHKYAPDQSQIILRVVADAHEVALEVEDHGPGIPPESMGRLFERFYRVPQTEEKVHGTGLGLAIVKSVVEKHQGRVAVRSTPGVGSTFSLILPVYVPITDS